MGSWDLPRTHPKAPRLVPKIMARRRLGSGILGSPRDLSQGLHKPNNGPGSGILGSPRYLSQGLPKPNHGPGSGILGSPRDLSQDLHKPNHGLGSGILGPPRDLSQDLNKANRGPALGRLTKAVRLCKAYQGSRPWAYLRGDLKIPLPGP